ncbi:MAG: Rieske (2Fe-2S) protein [bacterium]|nr:Rieske (2Fe-2S) protein [bacterium]
MPQHIRICALNELAPGSRRVVEINAFEEALVVHHNGHIFAISNICPHEGAALQRGLIEDNIIYCPLHQWGFDLSTGVYIEAPETCARVYTVEVRDRDLYLCIGPDEAS